MFVESWRLGDGREVVLVSERFEHFVDGSLMWRLRTSTVNRSVAAIAPQCAFYSMMKVLHDMLLPCSGAGTIPWSARILLMVLRPTSYPRFLSAPLSRVYPHIGFSCAMRTMSSQMSFDVSGRPGLRFLLPSYLAAMRSFYQRRSVSNLACDNEGDLINWAQRFSTQSLGLNDEPAALFVRELESFAALPRSCARSTRYAFSSRT